METGQPTNLPARSEHEQVVPTELPVASPRRSDTVKTVVATWHPDFDREGRRIADS